MGHCSLAVPEARRLTVIEGEREPTPYGEVVHGLHVVETDMAHGPVVAGALGMDGVASSPHQAAHFAK